MSISEMYYYLFYKIKELTKKPEEGNEDNKYKTILIITFLELWFIAPIYLYRNIVLGQRKTINLFSYEIFPFIIIIILKWFAFIRDDRWQTYAKRFDQWPEIKNSRGTYIVIGIFILTIVDFVIAASLYSNTFQ